MSHIQRRLEALRRDLWALQGEMRVKGDQQVSGADVADKVRAVLERDKERIGTKL